MVKRVRAARHYQHPRAPVRSLADNAIPAIARAFRTSLKAARRLFDAKKAAYLVAHGRWREVNGIIDWRHSDEAMRRPMALLGDVWIAAGEIGERKLNGAFSNRSRPVRFGVVRKDRADLFNYDRFDPKTQGRIRAFQDKLIAQLGKDSRAAVEQTILRALRAGLSPEDVMQEVRMVIGLTDKQALAVQRYREELRGMNTGAATGRALVTAADRRLITSTMQAGGQLDADTIDRLTEAYESAYLDYRALTIATTESTRAASIGLQDSYLQAVERGVLPAEAVRQMWQISLDERTCNHCLSVVDMNPDGVPLGDPFQSDEGPVDAPGLHPNCRCSLELVTDLDLVPDNYDG